MACSVVRSPLLRNPTVRHYAAAAAAQAAPSAVPETEVLNNKVTVATADERNPLSQVSVVFRAGTRNETYDTQGICHHLRIAAGLSTRRSSYFGITRNVQQLGGTITTTVDRESIAYTLQVTRTHVDEALRFLEDVTTHQVFKPWELADQLPRLRYELSTVPETTRVLELLHKAAFRTGLGYSLYSPKRQIGKINPESLTHFINTWFKGSRCAVVAIGVPRHSASTFAASLNIPAGDESDTPSRFGSGEIRKERTSEVATVAVATEGASLKSDKEVLAFAVLQRAAGTGPRVKWGSSPTPIYKPVASAAGNNPFALSTLNASYSDSGLFGFVLSAPADVAGSLTAAAYGWMKNPKLSDSDITRGKNVLKLEVYSAADHGPTMVEDLGQQILFRGKAVSTSTIISEIDKLSASDVQSVASKLASKPVAMSAIGDLRTVPFKDQLN